MKNFYFKIIVFLFVAILTAEISSQVNAGFIAGNFNLAKQGYSVFRNLKEGGNPASLELSTFNARIINNDVQLSWQTDTEINSFIFMIERMSSEDMIWRNVGEVAASGNSNTPKFYSFKDRNVTEGFYSYRLRMKDNNGRVEYSNELHIEVNQEDGFLLSQNYPNPFNPSTIITFELPEKSFVSLKIFNVLGNEIATLVNEEKPAGIHRIKFDVSEMPVELSNGTYFYMLKAGSYTETKKMIYIK